MSINIIATMCAEGDRYKKQTKKMETHSMLRDSMRSNNQQRNVAIIIGIRTAAAVVVVRIVIIASHFHAIEEMRVPGGKGEMDKMNLRGGNEGRRERRGRRRGGRRGKGEGAVCDAYETGRRDNRGRRR